MVAPPLRVHGNRWSSDRSFRTYRPHAAYDGAQMSLAEADCEELRRWFKPLGLVRRADSLIGSAKEIRDLYEGRVPRDLDALMNLPSIGLCMAFGEPVPMVDGSSGRLLRRLLGLQSSRPAHSDKELISTATSLIPEDRPKEFNLALIDIAAGFCRPTSPSCQICPLIDVCEYASSLIPRIQAKAIV